MLKNYGLKMTHPAENATLYSDEEGFIYANVPGQRLGIKNQDWANWRYDCQCSVPRILDFFGLWELPIRICKSKIAAFSLGRTLPLPN